MATKKMPGVRAGSKRGARASPAAHANTAEAGTPGPVALPRVSKGRRPQFHDSEAVDQLFAVVTALTAELSVAFDRLDTLERVLISAGALTQDCVETYQPSAEAAAARSAKREALIGRVFAVFEAYGAPRES